MGPDAGTPEQVRQVQSALRVAGYDVEASGTFDEATALAVIDFKYKNGLNQSYRMEDGVSAVNEYLDPASAKALFDRIQTVANEEASKLASKFRS
ncbi:putative peptidoglycan binding domain protein [compost metagenome]